MRLPIRTQIMLPLLAVAVASLATVGAINALVTERRTSSQLEERLRHVINVLTTSNFPLTPAVLRQMRDLSGAEFVFRDNNGATVASSLAVSAAIPEEAAIERVNDVRLGKPVSLDDRWYFHNVLSFPVDSRPGRSGTLHVLLPQDEYRKAWRQAFVPSLVVGAITLLAVSIVARLVANRMGQGISRLGKEVMRIARGDFRGLELPAIDDEIRDLSQAVNQTAKMLTDYEQQVRRSEQMRTLTMLGASIAHQIRNAATGCRMALDLHVADCNATDGGESLEVAERQLRLMESQIQRFLSLGRAPSEMTLDEIDLSGLVAALLPLVRPAAEHAGVALDCQMPTEHVIVRADSEALGQVVTNVVLNAVQAAQRQDIGRRVDRRVRIDITSQGDHAELTISDTGAGPAASVANALFEPFVTDRTEGAGLGLAVAREVVEAHGGCITWRREDGITRFRIVLPRMRSELSVQNSHR